MTIKERIENEWEAFYRMTMCLSKDAIFTKSNEIEIKRKIHCMISNLHKEGSEHCEHLLRRNDLLDCAYRYIKDRHMFAGSYMLEEKTVEYFKEWLEGKAA